MSQHKETSGASGRSLASDHAFVEVGKSEVSTPVRTAEVLEYVALLQMYAAHATTYATVGDPWLFERAVQRLVGCADQIKAALAGRASR